MYVVVVVVILCYVMQSQQQRHLIKGTISVSSDIRQLVTQPLSSSCFFIYR